MSRRNGLGRLGALVAMCLLVQLGIPPSAVAANTGTCQGAYRERHTGHYQGGTKWGAQAYFTAQSLSTCTNPTPVTISGSFAWVNIQGAGDSSNIVQMGIGRCRKPLSGECNGNMKVLYAWGRGASLSCLAQLPFPQEIAAWDGSAAYYKVSRVSSNWVLYWKGVARKSIPYSWTSCSWGPNSATYFTETWNDGDSLGGSSTNKFELRHMAYQNTIGGSFVFVNTSDPCSINDAGNPSKYFCDVYGSDEVQTWTVQ